jgi:cytochrome P450
MSRFFLKLLCAELTTPCDKPFAPMLQLDDPDHKRIRGLVSQAFNQRAVDTFRPRIRAISDELLDALTGRDSFDVIAEYAAPLPIIVIAEMLGVAARDLGQFKRWSDTRADSRVGAGAAGPR